MTFQPCSQRPPDAFQIEVLPPIRTDKSKRLVQPPFRIHDARHVFQLVRRKKFLRFGIVVGEMHEGDLHAPKFDIAADSSELGDRLAAKRSSKVA
jgi:hypothetical protein